MDPIIHGILKYKKTVVICFVAIAIFCGIVQFGVTVNYNMVDYLPANSESSVALNLMYDEFQEPIPNARVMLKQVNLQQALEYKKKLEAIPGVSNVMWLDDVVDLKKPLQAEDSGLVESYYKNNDAIISLTMSQDNQVKILEQIYEAIGEKNAVAGEAIISAVSQTMSSEETMKAMLVLVPIIILILMVSTTSWIEPLIFLCAVGASVLINMGSNLIRGEISFVTQSVSPILQLAVSLDYAIFLLHRFRDYRYEGDEPQKAMARAMKRSFRAILASAATTMFGFAALTFMHFEIGSDLGLSLVKGIIFSFISVMVFLPALTLLCYKWIDKTQHRRILPKFANIGRYVLKARVPCIIVVAVILVPSFLAQHSSSFLYGMGDMNPETRSGRDVVMIEQQFGKSTPVVILVPKGDVPAEQSLSQELEKLDHVTQVVSYTSMVGTAIPEQYMEKGIKEQFYSKDYSRIVAYTNTSAEGKVAFGTVDQIEKVTQKYYPGDTHLCGESVTLRDMKGIVVKDNRLVNLIAIFAIGFVLLIALRSLSMPILLLLTIETSIWVNLSVPYFTGLAICYIGYLVINTVQLGATVDYAILFSDHYLEQRRSLPTKEAVVAGLGRAFNSILTSAVILAASGFCLWLTSSNPIVSQLGLLLGRGTMLSLLMVTCFLPAMLTVTDPIVRRTTWKGNFYRE